MTQDRLIQDATAILAGMVRASAAEHYSGSLGLLVHLQDGHIQHYEETGSAVGHAWTAPGAVEQAKALVMLENALRRYARKGYHGSVGVVLYMASGVIQRIEGRRKQIHRVAK